MWALFQTIYNLDIWVRYVHVSDIRCMPIFLPLCKRICDTIWYIKKREFKNEGRCMSSCKCEKLFAPHMYISPPSKLLMLEYMKAGHLRGWRSNHHPGISHTHQIFTSSLLKVMSTCPLYLDSLLFCPPFKRRKNPIYRKLMNMALVQLSIIWTWPTDEPWKGKDDMDMTQPMHWRAKTYPKGCYKPRRHQNGNPQQAGCCLDWVQGIVLGKGLLILGCPGISPNGPSKAGPAIKDKESRRNLKIHWCWHMYIHTCIFTHLYIHTYTCIFTALQYILHFTNTPEGQEAPFKVESSYTGQEESNCPPSSYKVSFPIAVACFFSASLF